jgi:hypothetical protein
MKRNFKVGDRVRIRQWDDMEREYGVDYDGDIKCRPFFASGMRPLCGEEAKILSLLDNGRVALSFRQGGIGACSWNFCVDMLEPITNRTQQPLDAFYLVWNEDGGPPRRKHTSEEAARNEAERLARMTPGQKFHVIGSLGTVCAGELQWEPHKHVPEEPLSF